MADWRQVVRARLTELHLTASAESELTEEVAQHLEDLHRDLRSGGAGAEEAYRETISELDDICALRTGLDRGQRMASTKQYRLATRRPAPSWTTCRGICGMPAARFA